LSERLAKQTRRLLADDKTKDKCLDLFGKPDHQFLIMIIDKAMYASLRQAAYYRNNWICHTGVDSKKTWSERLILAEDILAQIRRVIADGFSNTPFISPELCDFDRGIYHTNASLLMGTRTVFKKILVNTIVPMEKNRLYLLSDRQTVPLKLLPLVRIMESPTTEQNACYFYNRVERDGVRWISYHFEMNLK
jgi:hypothetical protein